MGGKAGALAQAIAHIIFSFWIMVLYFKALNGFHIAGWSLNMEAPTY